MSGFERKTNNSGLLSRRQEAAVLILLTARSVAEAAKSAKISEATLWRWFQEPEFTRRYRALRRQLVEQGMTQLQQLVSEAVDCLHRNLTSGNSASECRAALGIISKAIDGLNVMDFDERIARLEALENERQREERTKKFA